MNDKPQPKNIPKERIDVWIAEDEAAAATLDLRSGSRGNTSQAAFGMQKDEMTPVDQVVRKLREGRQRP